MCMYEKKSLLQMHFALHVLHAMPYILKTIAFSEWGQGYIAGITLNGQMKHEQKKKET